MPSGSRRGRTRAPAAGDMPSCEREVLERRLALHRAGTGAGAAGDAHQIAELEARLAELLQEQREWPLDALQGVARLKANLDGDPLDLSLAQLGLSMWSLHALEQYGVLWVRELVEWTPAMLARISGRPGCRLRDEVAERLAIVGLRLKDDAPEKDPAAVASGRKGGLKGGVNRMAKLTPEERAKLGRKGAKARWRDR